MEENATLSFTTLIDQHKKLGAKLAPFGGWLMPIQYSGIIDEHNWTRRNAGLFDICHMGEFHIEADLKKSNLAEIVTVNLNTMKEGSCRYGFMLNERGGIIDDLVVYRISESRWMFVVNAATTNSDEAHMRKYLNSFTRFDNISYSLGKLDIQGPQSVNVLRKLIKRDPGLKYYTFAYFNLLGEDIIISRTGYTGELGYELYMPNKKIVDLWEMVLKDELVKPIGLGARDTLRLEIGYSLYGQDLDENTTPLEAGLGYFIDWSKEFIGKVALQKEKEKGLSKTMISFTSVSRRSPRHNYRILYKGDDIGYVTSGSFAPSLGIGIGIGYVNREVPLGDPVELAEGKVVINAIRVNKPFYKNGSIKGEGTKNAYT